MKKYFGLLIAVIGLIFASCNFNSNSEVSYKVLHMQQNIENDGYTVAEEESFKGRIGSKIKIQTKDYEGFSSKPVEVQTIKEDLSVPVYYDRNPVTFDFNLAGGKGETTITKKYGTPVTKEIIPDPVKGTSKFSFWSPALPETFMEDTTFTANWDYSSYKVKFMFQNAEDDEYSPDTGAVSPEEIYFGNSGEETTYNPPIIQGFELNRVEQAILGEEEQTVTVYYDRVTVTVLIDLDGGDGISLVKGRMGSSFTDSLLGTYTKKGYVFEGFDKELPETFRLEDNNKTILKALWRGDGQARYSVRFYYENLDRTFTEDKDYTVNLVGQVGENTDISFNDGKVYLVGTERSLKEGFHPVTEEDKDYKSYTLKNEIIKGDETTLAKVYCARNVSTMTFDLKGGNVDGNEEPVVISGRWGEKIDFPAVTPKKLGYTFTQFKQETTKYTDWPSESMELTGIAEYSVNKYKVRVYGNYGDEDLPGKVEYFETESSYENDVDNTISFVIPSTKLDYYSTGYKMVKPMHACKGISKTEDGEIENFEVEEYSTGKYRIKIPVEKETVENDGKIITFYCQWEPYKIGKINSISQNLKEVKYGEDGTLRFAVKYTWSTTSESYTADEWGKPEYVFSIGDKIIGVVERTPNSSDYYSYNLKDQGFSFESSTPVPLKVQLRYNISATPDKPKYLTGEETECYFYTPLEPATNLRVVDKNSKIECSWTNPKSKTGIVSVKLGAMKVKSDGNYSKNYDGNYQADSSWSINNADASDGECDSEAMVTGKLSRLTTSAPYVCYVEVRDAAGFVSCTELVRAFPVFDGTTIAGGQFFYEDGTFSDEFIEGKIPVGISLGRNNLTTDGIRIMGLKALDEAVFCKNNVTVDISSMGYDLEKKITDAGLDVNDFEALKYCLDYNEGGFDDWYLADYYGIARIFSKTYNEGVLDSLRILKENGIECLSIEPGKYYWGSAVDFYSNKTYYTAYSTTVSKDRQLLWSDLEALGPVGVIPIRIIMDSQYN